MRWCLAVVALLSMACASGTGSEDPATGGGKKKKARDAQPAPASGSSKLLPASKLKGGCFGQPGAAWTPSNHADAQIFVQAGDAMTDFTLSDIDGKKHTLSKLLEDKPVLMFTGSYSCPEYRGDRPKVDRIAKEFGGELHVLAVHGPEAHPKSDPSPYKGKPKPDKYSDVELAGSLDERVSFAKKVGDAPGLTVLVEPMDNPVWCTVGTLPNGAWLIGQDGVVVAAHDWFDPKSMMGSVKGLVR